MQSSFVAMGPSPAVVEEESGKGPDMKILWADKVLRKNLIASCMCWLHASFNFYLITFYLKKFPGNIYINSMCFACADLLAYMSSGLVLKYFMVRQGLFFSYSVSLIAGLLYLANYNTTKVWLIPALVAISRIGGSMSFNIGYVSVSRLFPTNYVTTVFGIVNFFSHIITVGAPVVAELEEPIPFVVFCINSASAIVFSMQLLEVDKARALERKKQEKEKKKKLKNFISQNEIEKPNK